MTVFILSGCNNNDLKNGKDMNLISSEASLKLSSPQGMNHST